MWRLRIWSRACSRVWLTRPSRARARPKASASSRPTIRPRSCSSSFIHSSSAWWTTMKCSSSGWGLGARLLQRQQLRDPQVAAVGQLVGVQSTPLVATVAGQEPIAGGSGIARASRLPSMSRRLSSSKGGRVRRISILLGGIAVLALLLTPATGTASSSRRAAAAASSRDSPAVDARGRGCTRTPAPPATAPTRPAPATTRRCRRSTTSAGRPRSTGCCARAGCPGRTTRARPSSAASPLQRRGHPRPGHHIGKAVGDAQIPDVDPARGDLQRGRELYGQACAACHGMNGAGAARQREHRRVAAGRPPPGRGRGDQDRPRADAGRRRLADYEFGTAQSQQDVDDIAAYVESLRTDPYNEAAPHRRQGPVPEGSWPG